MATTSGTSTFNYNRDQIIKSALRKIGAFASNETPDTNSLNDGSDALNIMVKGWDATGIHIWTEEEGVLFLQPKQVSYTVGGSTSDHLTGIFNSTTLGAAASNAATNITVSSISGISNGDKIAVQIDDGTLFWTTVNGAPSGTTVTLTAALTDTAANANPVYNYTTDLSRPLRIVSGRRFVYSSAIDTPMIPLSRLDYRNLPNKTSTGTPTQFFYDPRGGAATQGVISVWPAPADALSAMKFTYYRPLQDFNAAANIPDLPNEWLGALIYNLALEIAPEYDLDPSGARYQMIEKRAAYWLDLATGWDREIESYNFGVEMSQV